MRVRHAADYRTLIWALVLFPIVPAIEYLRPALAPFVLPVGLYLAFAAGAIVHNHNHSPVFTGRRANVAYGVWLSVFYGFPIFSWIPTHNRNHHRFRNADGDVTRTWRLSSEHTLLRALVFPTISSYWQAGLLAQFVRDARRRNPPMFRAIVVETAGVIVAHAALFLLAVQLHGLSRGALTYAAAFGLPALFAPWSMMFVNYVQHVHCDPASRHDHSRNFVGAGWNWLMFNAGYHTVHHENPGTHWSEYRLLHEQLAKDIHPSLNERSLAWFCLKNYVLGAFDAGYRTRQIGVAPESVRAAPGAAAFAGPR
jgi:fatty acid desaturase